MNSRQERRLISAETSPERAISAHSDTLGVRPATMIVRPKTHWLNGWFLRLCARAVVRVDRVEYAARGGRPVIIEVEAGDHRVAIGTRY